MDKIYLLIGNDTPLAVCLRKSEGEGDPVPYDLSTAERMRLALVGHGMHVFAEDIEISGEDNNIISGVILGRSLLKGDYDLEVTFNLDGRDKRFAINDMFEAVDFLAEDQDGTAEGEGAGIFVTITVQPELIEISGPAGPQGKSAYQVWLDDGHTGTEDDFFEWLAAQTPNPDWNQNDSTKADFIKNRTHWEEESTTTIPDAKLAWSGSTPEDLDFWFHGTNVHIPRTSTGWGLTWQGGELFIDDNGFGYELGVYNGEEWSINPFDPSYDQQPYPLGVDVVITSGTTIHKLDNKFLDMDSEPTTGSGKPVTSGGVKAAIADFVTRAVNDLLNYYTKTETYTKAEVNQLVAGINNWEIVPVAQLPEASADTMHKIYLVPSSNPKTRNVKDEFITVEVSGAYSWEQIGTTAIDLTNYVTRQDLTTALADYVTSSAFTQALALKQDVIADLSQIREGATDNVKYTSQSLTDAQKTQARTNIAAASEAEVSQLRSEVYRSINIFTSDYGPLAESANIAIRELYIPSGVWQSGIVMAVMNNVIGNAERYHIKFYTSNLSQLLLEFVATPDSTGLSLCVNDSGAAILVDWTKFSGLITSARYAITEQTTNIDNAPIIKLFHETHYYKQVPFSEITQVGGFYDSRNAGYALTINSSCSYSEAFELPKNAKLTYSKYGYSVCVLYDSMLQPIAAVNESVDNLSESYPTAKYIAVSTGNEKIPSCKLSYYTAYSKLLNESVARIKNNTEQIKEIERVNYNKIDNIFVSYKPDSDFAELFDARSGWSYDSVSKCLVNSSLGISNYLRCKHSFACDPRKVIYKFTPSYSAKIVFGTVNDITYATDGNVAFSIDFSNGVITNHGSFANTPNLSTSLNYSNFVVPTGYNNDLFILSMSYDHRGTIISLWDATKCVELVTDYVAFNKDTIGQDRYGYDKYYIYSETGTMQIFDFIVKTDEIPGGCRAYFVGDSITWGVQNPDINTVWSYMAAEHIQNSVVSGRSGCQIIQVQDRLEVEAAALKPQYVIMMIGQNGGNTEALLTKAISTIYEVGAVPIVCTNIQSSDATTITPVNSQILSVCSTLGLVPVRMDIATSVNGDISQGQDSSLFASGNVHPNADGSKKMFLRLFSDHPELW